MTNVAWKVWKHNRLMFGWWGSSYHLISWVCLGNKKVKLFFQISTLFDPRQFLSFWLSRNTSSIREWLLLNHTLSGEFVGGRSSLLREYSQDIWRGKWLRWMLRRATRRWIRGARWTVMSGRLNLDLWGLAAQLPVGQSQETIVTISGNKHTLYAVAYIYNHIHSYTAVAQYLYDNVGCLQRVQSLLLLLLLLLLLSSCTCWSLQPSSIARIHYVAQHHR